MLDVGAEAGGFAVRRLHLIEHLREQRHLRTEPVTAAMAAVPREEFVPRGLRQQAYEDRPLSIGRGQTISAPHMVAIMSEALDVRTGHNVLEVGTGSGYQAAVLSRLVGPQGRVITLERHAGLADRARRALEGVRASNVRVVTGDGSLGHPEAAPYDRILVTAAAPALPPPLVSQLAIGGTLLAPVGGRSSSLIRARRTREGLEQEDLGACAFVPLKGAHGHPSRVFGAFSS